MMSHVSLSTRGLSTSCLRSIRYIPHEPYPVEPASPFRGNKVYSPEVSKLEHIKLDFKGMRFNNKRHLREHKKLLFKPFEARLPEFSDIEEHKYGCRGSGIRHRALWEHVPEMVPQLIVPDLKDCKLKPYVSYTTKEIYQEEMTSKDLFNVIYGKKILTDYKAGKLDEQGQPLEPSEEEKLSPDEAWIKARQSGSDIFQGGKEPSKEWSLNYSRK